MENVAITRVRARTDALENEVRQLKTILTHLTVQFGQLKSAHDRLERIVTADLARREVNITDLVGPDVPMTQPAAGSSQNPAAFGAAPAAHPQAPMMDPRMFAAMQQQQQQQFQPRPMVPPGPSGPAMSNDRAMELLRQLRGGM